MYIFLVLLYSFYYTCFSSLLFVPFSEFSKNSPNPKIKAKIKYGTSKKYPKNWKKTVSIIQTKITGDLRKPSLNIQRKI